MTNSTFIYLFISFVSLDTTTHIYIRVPIILYLNFDFVVYVPVSHAITCLPHTGFEFLIVLSFHIGIRTVDVI